jgi:hypothetical protein
VLIEEFHQYGAEIVFQNRSIGGTAKDELLLQIRGIMLSTSVLIQFLHHTELPTLGKEVMERTKLGLRSM